MISVGRIDYWVRSKTGSEMGAFFAYLAAATFGLLMVLLAVQGAFAPLKDEPETAYRAQVAMEIGEKGNVPVANNQAGAAIKPQDQQRTISGTATVNLEPAVQGANPAKEKDKKENGFSWGKVDNTTNQAWVGLWSLLLTIPITAISAIFAIRIAMRAEKLSQGERPEYQEAFDAAKAYAVFKSLTITLPLLLRQAQRDGLFDGKGGLVKKINDTIAEAQKKLQESSVPILLDSIAEKAWKRRKTVKDSIHMRMLHSSLLYAALWQRDAKEGKEKDAKEVSGWPWRQPSDAKEGEENTGNGKLIRKDFMRWTSRAYEYVSHVDNLIGMVEKELIPKSVRTPADMQYQEGGDPFTEIEFWFIRHVSPATRLNNELKLKDLEDFRTEIKSDVLDYLGIAGTDLPPLKSDLPDKSIVFCINETGLYEVAEALWHSNKSKWLDINVNEFPKAEDLEKNSDDRFLCVWPLDHAKAIIKASDLIARFGDKADEYSSRIVLLLDQGERYRDSSEPGFSSYFRFSQLCFIALQTLSYVKKRDEDQEWEDSADQKFFKYAGILTEQLEFKTSEELKEEWKNGKPEYQFYCAAVRLGLPEETADDIGIAYTDALYRILDALATFKSDDNKRSLESVVKACTTDLPAEFDRLLAYLAQRPLIDRPVVGFMDRIVGGESGDRVIDVDLKRAGLIVTAYVDSQFHVERSPLVKLMLDGIWRKDLCKDEIYKNGVAYISV